MASLLFLNSADFLVQDGPKGTVLCNNLQGLSMVLFYADNCVHCKNLIPIFKTLNNRISGCQFGMLNVMHNKKCIMDSRSTIGPIMEVPYMVLYVNGRPYMRYKGPHDQGEIIRFIVEISNKIRSQRAQSAKEPKRSGAAGSSTQSEKKGIPEYTIGTPICGEDDKVCYLDFNEAYVTVR